MTTEDGYILQLHRVRSDLSKMNPKGTVLLQHGLSFSSYQWIVNKPEGAHAFALAQEGYDVWLGNNRGNEFSKKHVNLNINDAAFWEFSFEEMGLYDIPASVNYIKQKTGF